MQAGQAGGQNDGAPALARLPEGVRPLDHLRQVLERSLGGQRDGLLLLTHRSPDPDALGAITGLAFLLREAFGLEPMAATHGRIHRAENQAMVRELDLRFADFGALETEGYGGALLVDSQPSFGNTDLPEAVPVLGVFDHHQPPDDEVLAHYRVPHYDVRLGMGATSAMIYEYIRDAGLQLDARTATALCCGVRFDTADLSARVTDLDREAYFETFRRADRGMLARIARPELPATYYRELHRSLSRARRQGPLVYGLLGRVANPESVAEMADFFRRMEGCRWSLVGGAFEDRYHLSLRTDLDYAEAYGLLASVLDGEGSFGGRGPVAGGQVPLPQGDDHALRTLERRLRGRALRLALADGPPGTPLKSGTRLTRLS